ncbi:reverse transcriptase domain-containing protein, partial [Tanacetum coccineum]
MLENEPWLIRNMPLILRKWSLMVNVSKEDWKSVRRNVHILDSIRAEYEWKPIRCSTCKLFGHSLDQCPKKVVLDVNVKTQRQDVRGLHVGPKSHLIYKPIQPMTVKKSDTMKAKPKYTNSTKVCNNLLDLGADPIDTVSLKSDMVDVTLGNKKYVNFGNKKDVNLDNEDSNINSRARFNAMGEKADMKAFIEGKAVGILFHGAVILTKMDCHAK